MASQFDEDIRKERLFGEWLAAHFYPHLSMINGCYISAIERCEDETLQKRGVDVIITTDWGDEIYVDEKAALHYINQDLPTFSFEIKNARSGAQGWLYNRSYITDYYLLAWPNATDITIPDLNAFTKSEVMLIRREAVIQMLRDKGITQDSVGQKIRECYGNRYETNKIVLCDGIQLNFNLTLYEQPINLIIRKKLLSRYAEYSGYVG